MDRFDSPQEPLAILDSAQNIVFEEQNAIHNSSSQEREETRTTLHKYVRNFFRGKSECSIRNRIEYFHCKTKRVTLKFEPIRPGSFLSI